MKMLNYKNIQWSSIFSIFSASFKSKLFRFLYIFRHNFDKFYTNMEIIKTKRGGKKLCFDGFMYTLRAKTKNYINWICVKRGNYCKGILFCNRIFE